MKYYIFGLYFFIGSFLSFGQEKITSLSKKLNEIDLYRKDIDANKEKYIEVYDTKAIKNLELEERRWEAYVLKEKPEEKQILRIRFITYALKEIVIFIFYYKNGKIVFGEYFRKLKHKNNKNSIYKAIFYFENAVLIHQKNSSALKLDSRTFLESERNIKQMFLLEN